MFTPEKRKEGHGAKREGRMFQILTILYDHKIRIRPCDDDATGLTSTQIARQMGLAPSWYVRDMLLEMRAEGWVQMYEKEKGNGAVAFIWFPATDVEFSDKWHAAFIAWYEVLQVGLPGWSKE